ncbi:MAG TPA: tetratricopeptide repeat protein [Gemmataceae bacterium]|nr:tetratricopeptide repeat protein [Gemmataceae bacterium]
MPTTPQQGKRKKAKGKRKIGKGRLVLFPFAFFLLPCLGCPPRIDERARAYTEDGLDLFQRGDYFNARESFEEALVKQPGDANLLYNIGQCYDRQGKTDRAEEYYRRCLGQSGNHANCRHAFAVLLRQTSRQHDADQMVQDWLAAEPELPDAYVEDGWRRRQAGDVDGALKRYQQALHLNPHHVRALIELGMLYESWQLSERALVLYEKALAEDPKQPGLVEQIHALHLKGVRRPRPD